ncbi:MAG TPA: NAD(P)/FAD-dependent oxidoreductase [Candidatus Limnocylindria bacterium]|nr:NAD(P)/FAD-dependent oxidoreductase [Candidatus Limnocylindria bacterium]
MSRDLDAVIVGAGFAGLCMLYRLRERRLRAQVFEAGGGVGGTWYWNRYPGCRCDVESLEYSYQFSEELQQEWEWTERYASQPEILRYLNHVADRFDLRRDITLDTRVTSAVFDEAADRWIVCTDRGHRVAVRFCIMATGCLSAANTPGFPGLESFRGRAFHTGRWPHEEVDFTGRRVAVIGTGSSGIQAIPLIAEQAAHLFVFQRTPNYSVPAQNHPLDPAVQRAVKRDYAALRRRGSQMPFGFDTRSTERSALEVSDEERLAEYEERWRRGGLPFLGAFSDMIFDRRANETAAEFIRGKIREIVRDPEVAERLMPRGVVGCKRLCSDTGYFETFNRPNVTLVDVAASPIEAITEHGIRTGEAHYAVDDIVFATGFDAMTGALARIDIRGRGGLALRDKWAHGPRTYLGLATAGFPNLFIMTGPGSPSVLSNMVPSIEQHAGWIAACIAYLDARGLRRIEPSEAAEDAWVAHVNEIADATLYPTCNSWYLGANIPGKPRVFMPYLGFPAYVEKCDQVAKNHYEGFETGNLA